MIRELQKKFILINMALVFLVLAVVFTVLCVSTFNQARDESKMALISALNRRGGGLPPLRAGQKPPEDFVRPPFFVIQLSETGAPRLQYSGGLSLDEADLKRIFDTIIPRSENEGIVREYNLRFMKRIDHGGQRIAFVEISGEQNALGRIILISSLSMAAALLAFFVISFFLSKWAFKPAEQAWQQQRRFVADASHELKTPLTVILANAGILKSKPRETVGQLWNWVENTEAEALRMKKLVDDLLFLAKSDDAKTPPVHSRVNLSDTVLSSVLAFESVAFERKITVKAEDLSPGVFVKGDEARLRQLAGILLDNAVKYSESPGTVTVSLAARQKTAVLSVHNRGTPLSSEDMKHLFERFYRADQSRSREGYGLGLAIAKSIADLHQGRITAACGAASGTVFTVSLPLCCEK